MEKPKSCMLCPLYASKEGIVWGEGPKDAKVMYIAEAPGEDEGVTKRPFSGGAGRVLNGLLAHAHVRREDVFITNVIRCRPTAMGAAGRLVNRAPTDEEIRACAPLLLQELEDVNPNVIVALGNVPMHVLTDIPKKRGIQVCRSVPTEGPKRRVRSETEPERYKVIGTIHPAGVMRQQHLWPLVVYDLVRAQAQGQFPEIIRRPWKRIIHAYLPDVGDALMRRIRTPRVHGWSYYFHDLETTGGIDPRTNAIRCVGVAAEPDEVFCFDRTPDVERFVAELHADQSLLTVGQNSEAFDIPFQEAKGYVFNGPTYDTLIGFHQLNSALPKDLASLGASSTDELFWKDDTMYKSGEDALHVGCCKDVHATGMAFHDQIIEMEQIPGQIELYFDHIMPLQPVLRNMTKRGLRKDIRAAAGWHIILNRKADELEIRLKKALGDTTFNVDSPSQLMDLLYNRMKLPIQYKQDHKRGMRPTVDADALDNLALLTNNPIFTLVRSIRTLRKWDSTFVRCPQDEHGIVHPHFGSAKASTGRLNSYDPNFQNWPLEVREIIVADDADHILISKDWKGIEWRIAMTLSGARRGLEALVAGRDPHKDTWANNFNIAYDEVTGAMKFEAKTINYGLLYGRSNDSVAAGRPGHPESAMPIDRVNAYVAGLHSQLPEYFEYRTYIERFVMRNHYFETGWKRRRYWYTRQQLPEAFNYPMQGNAAHMMYEALVELEAQLPKGATLRASVHDECLVGSHVDVAAQAEECMKDVMEKHHHRIEEASLYPNVVKQYFPQGWYCPTDGHVGVNWRACKDDSKEAVQAEVDLRKRLGLRPLDKA